MIYVDEMMPGLKSHRWPYTEACHLFWADDVNRESGTTVANRRWLQRMLGRFTLECEKLIKNAELECQ